MIVLKPQIEPSIDAASSEEVEWAVSHAQTTFDSGIWSKASSIHRASVLSRLAVSLQQRIPDMARIDTMQTGRPIREMNAQMTRLPEWLSVVILQIMTVV